MKERVNYFPLPLKYVCVVNVHEQLNLNHVKFFNYVPFKIQISDTENSWFEAESIVQKCFALFYVESCYAMII